MCGGNLDDLISHDPSPDRGSFRGQRVQLIGGAVGCFPPLGDITWVVGGPWLHFASDSTLALTLGRTVYVRPRKLAIYVALHEWCHTRQFEDKLFLLKYFGRALRHGHDTNPYERAADVCAMRLFYGQGIDSLRASG